MKQGKSMVGRRRSRRYGTVNAERKRGIEQADVVLYDKLVGTGILNMIPDKSCGSTKGGDPFVRPWRRGIGITGKTPYSFEVVPGVTSAVSVPAYAGIPVTHRNFCFFCPYHHRT